MDFFFSKTCDKSGTGHTLDDLKQMCRELNLKISGNKSELCERLNNYYKNHKNKTKNDLSIENLTKQIENINIRKRNNSISNQDRKDSSSQNKKTKIDSVDILTNDIKNININEKILNNLDTLPQYLQLEIIKQLLNDEGFKILPIICSVNSKFFKLCKDNKDYFKKYMEINKLHNNKEFYSFLYTLKNNIPLPDEVSDDGYNPEESDNEEYENEEYEEDSESEHIL